MRKQLLAMILLGISVFTLTACTSKKSVSENGQTSVLDYKYTDSSKAEISFASDPDQKIDISEYVTNYSSGDLFLTAEGLLKVFNLKEVQASDKDLDLMKNSESTYNYETATNDVIKLEDESHYFLFRNGSNLYVYDGTVNNLSNAIIKTESGNLSYPLFDIIFKLGYESIGTSVNDNVISYTIYETTATKSSADLSQSNAEDETIVPFDETTESSVNESNEAEVVEPSETESVNNDTDTNLEPTVNQ